MHQGKSRWHSCHVLVYIRPVLAYINLPFGDCIHLQRLIPSCLTIPWHCQRVAFASPQAFGTLGNVAGDSPPKRDACLQAGALLAILPILDRCRDGAWGHGKGWGNSQVTRPQCQNQPWLWKFSDLREVVLPDESIFIFFFIYASVRIIHRPVYWKLYLGFWTLFNWGRLLFDGLTAFKHAQGSPPCL